MSQLSGHEVDAYFNQLAVNTEADFAGTLERLHVEVYGLEHAESQPDSIAIDDVVRVVPDGEGGVVVTFDPDDAEQRREIAFKKGALFDGTQQESRQLGPNFDDLQTALSVLRAVRRARFNGGEW